MFLYTASSSSSAWLFRSSGASPTPAFTAACTRPGRSSTPSTVTDPVAARRAPYTVSSTSERPEPTSPARPTISPARTVNPIPANSPGRVRSSTSSTTGAVLQDLLAGREDVLDRAAGHQPDEFLGRRLAGVQAGGDGGAVLQHGDAVADLADLLEPVRDVDDGHAARGEAADDPEQVATSSGSRTADGSSITIRCASRDSARAMLTTCWPAGGQRTDRPVDRDLAVAEALQDLAGPGRRLVPAAEAEAGRLVAEEDVLGNGQVGDQVELLVDRRDAAVRSPRSGC